MFAKQGFKAFLESGLALRDHGLPARRRVLDADAGKEQPQVLGDFGNGRNGRLARAPGDTLLDGHGGGDPAKFVHVGARHLFDKLPGVSRHTLHEAALALGEDDVKG